jgi:histidinol-phosphatase
LTSREDAVNPEWRNRYDAAVEAAQAASRLALDYFSSELAVEWKEDHSPVTRADREAEASLREALLGAFPHDGFLGEEHGEQAGTSGFRWIIDPIDGTRNFVRGIPIWATLVGLEYKDEQIAGVADVATLGHTYRALRGDGAYRNEQRIRVSPVTTLGEAQVFYSSVSGFINARRVEAFVQLARRTERQRGFGDFYGYVLVAQGSGEVMADYGVSAWDVAALKALLEEAGGRLTDWDGNPTIHRTDVLASNGRLHGAALAVLSGASGEESTPANKRREGGPTGMP